jgi:hypothetical protein
MWVRSLGGIINIKIVECGGQDGNLWHPDFHISRRRHFAFYRNSEFL